MVSGQEGVNTRQNTAPGSLLQYTAPILIGLQHLRQNTHLSIVDGGKRERNGALRIHRYVYRTQGLFQSGKIETKG